MRKNKLYTCIAAVAWLIASCEKAPAQEPVGRTIDSIRLQYPFVRTDLNMISNDSVALASIYEKLYELKTGKRDRVTIVHIGDSHIQADLFSGEMRQSLQLQFGNAGLGTVFPYRTAKSNEPYAYRSSASNNDWVYKRNVFVKDTLPIGLCGYTIATLDTNASILLTTKDQPGLDYSFNKFTLFHSKGAGYFDFAVCDELHCQLGYLDATQGDPEVSVLNFPTPMHSFMLDCMPHDSTGKRAEIYGMLLENGQPGLLYNTIGVNGAMYYSYNRSVYFLEQLAYLKPDLIILSMGTNEGYATNFKSETLNLNMDTLISNLKKVAPGSAFLVTTPGDSFRRTRNGRVKNPDMKEARNTVVNYCTAHQLAYWDLYEIMGGYGSMGKWFAAGLSAKDRVHFSKPGYQLQGDLFYDAFMAGYEKYVISNHGK